MMRNAATWRWLVLLAFAGCGVPDASPRGFGSRQILAIRDPQLRLGGFTEDESKVYLARYVQMPPASGFPPPHDLSTLNLTTAGMDLVAPAVFRTTALAGGALTGDPATGELARGHSLALMHYLSDADVPPDFASITGPKPGRLQLSIVNETTGRRLDIADVADDALVVFGTSDSDPITLHRFDPPENAPGGLTPSRLWFGPPNALQVVPPGFANIVGFDASGAFGWMTLGGLGPSDIRHIPLDGGDQSIVVPPTLGEYIVIPDELGAVIPPDPASGGPFNPWYGCVPGVSPDAPSRCFFVYSRTGANGSLWRLFARATDDPRELVLPGVSAGTDVLKSATALLWTAEGPSANHLYSWTFGADQVGGCDVPAGLVRFLNWNATQDQFAAYIAANDPAGGGILPGAKVLGVPGGACHVIPAEAMYYNFSTFSPDGTVFAWHEFLANGGTAIHLTATDGTGERRLDLPGRIYTSEFLGDHRLLLRRSSGDGIGLSFIDLADDPVRDHAIADRIATTGVWIDDHWLLLGDSRSRQDDTFTLRVVNIDTGASRPVSPSVAGFVTPWFARPTGATVLSVAYLVRGRAPSAQDGIWLATLPLDDFLP